MAVGVVRLPAGATILQQLHVEEALFKRHPDRSYLLVHHAAPPAVVLGMSGQVHRDVVVERVVADGVPVIRRFSGGGTVYVDRSTLFSTLISTADFLRPDQVKVFPREVMAWVGGFYRRAFADAHVEDGAVFALRENDYVWGRHKFGGNAQRMSSARWLQHTSFLWDFEEVKLNAYLAHPEKQPAYRLQRPHSDFVCRLKDRFPARSIEDMVGAIRGAMGELGVELVDVPATEVEGALEEARAAGQLSSHAVELGLPPAARDTGVERRTHATS